MLRLVEKIPHKTVLSQFPVYRGQAFLGLLTERCIARWLAHNTEIGLVALDETAVGDLLQYDESKGKNVEFIGRGATVWEARERFSQALPNGRPYLDALLITHSGRSTESLLGIITPWDMLDASTVPE